MSGKGCISIRALQAGKMSVGPHELGAFDALEAMDADGDGEVTRAEMEGYFGVVGADMSDAQFHTLLKELRDIAADASLINRLMAIAAGAAAANGADGAPSQSGATAGGGDGGESAPTAAVEAASEEEEAEAEAAEEAPPLSASRVELLRRLYSVFAPAGDDAGGICVATVGTDCTVELGPRKLRASDFLAAMDADADGRVSFDEMATYFRGVGASLDDEAFELIVGDMVDAASTASLLKAAAAA